MVPHLTHLIPAQRTVHTRHRPQILELLTDHLAQWGCSIAFPELAHMVLLQLRRFAKSSPVERFRRHTRALIEAIDK